MAKSPPAQNIAGQNVDAMPVWLATGVVVATAIPAVTAVAYAAGAVIGTKMEFQNMARDAGGTGLLQTVEVFCRSIQTAAVDLVLFHTDPATSTITNNTALSVSAADFDKLIGVIHITDWTNLGVASLAQADNIAKAYRLPGTSIYAALVARGALTLTSPADIKAALKALAD